MNTSHGNKFCNLIFHTTNIYFFLHLLFFDVSSYSFAFIFQKISSSTKSRTPISSSSCIISLNSYSQNKIYLPVLPSLGKLFLCLTPPILNIFFLCQIRISFFEGCVHCPLSCCCVPLTRFWHCIFCNQTFGKWKLQLDSPSLTHT